MVILPKFVHNLTVMCIIYRKYVTDVAKSRIKMYAKTSTRNVHKVDAFRVLLTASLMMKLAQVVVREVHRSGYHSTHVEEKTSI